MFDKFKKLKDQGTKQLSETAGESIEALTSKTLTFVQENASKANATIEDKLGIDIHSEISSTEKEDIFKVLHLLLPFPLNLIPEEKFLYICNDQSDKIMKLLDEEDKPV